MGEISLDKVKLALLRMDEDYWNKLVDRISVLSKQTEQVTKIILETCTELAVAQVGIIEARYEGYIWLTEEAEGRDSSTIINEKKEKIGQLMEQKRQKMSALSKLLAFLQNVISETETLGEAPLQPVPPEASPP
jgi:hypothetical protein